MLDLNLAVQLVVLIGGLSALWYRVETRISKGAIDAMSKAKEAMERADKAHEKLNDFRLEVAENYAKSAMMKEVETRILEKFEDMRKDFQDAMISMGVKMRRRT